MEPPGAKKNPEAAWSYAHLGEAQRLLLVQDAKDSFKAAIERSKMAGKKNSYALAHLGEYYRSSDPGTIYNLKQARKHFSEAIDAINDPPYLWAYAHRGASYNFGAASDDEINEALEDFKTAINLSGETYAWTFAFRAGLYLYMIDRELGKEKKGTKTDPGKIRDYAMHAWKDLLTAMSLDCTIISPDSPIVENFLRE